MLDEVPPQELEAFVVLVEEHSIILVSLLKGLDGLGCDGLYFLLYSLELLVLLQGQLTLSSQVVQDLHLLLGNVGLIHG